MNTAIGAPRWRRMADEAPEFPAGCDTVTCIVVREHGHVTAMDWTRNRYAKTPAGQAPRWEYHWRLSPWTVVWWAYLPPPPEEVSA